MGSYFQAAPLVASPCYPNAIAWSEENLVAIASGYLVTILNPASLAGPRGLITIPSCPPFRIGVVKKEDLLTPCLMPTCVLRDTRPCARSISWSHPGLAPNSGCLLALCTTEGRVKLYRSPFCEFRAEWVEVIDLSVMLYDYFVSTNFGESITAGKSLNEEMSGDDLGQPGFDMQESILCKGPMQRKAKMSSRSTVDTSTAGKQLDFGRNEGFSPHETNGCDRTPSKKLVNLITEVATFPSSIFNQGCSVEVLKQVGSQRAWISGVIKSMDVAKALVLYTETTGDGEQDEWVELNAECDKQKDSILLDGSVADHGPCLPKLRPSMNLGNLPKEILLVELHRIEEVLRTEQPVEAWVDNRWVEGSFAGFSGHDLQIKLSGHPSHVTLEPSAIRLAPVWNENLKSWQITLIKFEEKDTAMCNVVEIKSKNLHQSFSVTTSEGEPLKRRVNDGCPPVITPWHYASRSALLSSLVVAWSPLVQLSSESGHVSPKNFRKNCAILAVGGKSGKISFWRIHEPQCYTIEDDAVPVDAMLIELLQAHNGWVTAISWGQYAADASYSHFLLATGSSDGSVKIWLGDAEGLVTSSEVKGSSFSLLKEVITVTSIPVSSLSLAVPQKSVDKVLLAIGKGSGSVEVWICYISSSKFQNAGSYDAHDQVVTGIVWAFDCHCLFSCSQDNSVRSWILRGTTLCEIPFPSTSPISAGGPSDLLLVSDSCFGLAMSPGDLMVAVARSFDADLLDPMYQARTQKAAVEFFWTGGLQLEHSICKYPSCGTEVVPDLTENDLACWESNILWSLEKHVNICETLTLWDIIAALLGLKQSAPKFVEVMLFKWLSNWSLGGDSCLSAEQISCHTPSLLPRMESRRLHLLNVICRRLMLVEKADMLDGKDHKLGAVSDVDEQLKLWIELLVTSERELRQRLVGFTFIAVLSCKSSSSTSLQMRTWWIPVGLAQMEKWLAVNHDLVQDDLKLLGSQVGDLIRRIPTICEYEEEEKCNFCSASVPFESPEFAFCEGTKSNGIVNENHRLVRCAVSMQVCPTTTLWFCICCLRWVSQLAPQSLFTMSKSLDFRSVSMSSLLQEFSTPLSPLCPFCGILLQRLLPEFLLSTSPV